MRKITRNAIKCKHCGDVIESTYRHNFVTCSCGCCSVDGGHDYFRRGFMHSQKEDYIDLSETVEVAGTNQNVPALTKKFHSLFIFAD